MKKCSFIPPGHIQCALCVSASSLNSICSRFCQSESLSRLSIYSPQQLSCMYRHFYHYSDMLACPSSMSCQYSPCRQSAKVSNVQSHIIVSVLSCSYSSPLKSLLLQFSSAHMFLFFSSLFLFCPALSLIIQSSSTRSNEDVKQKWFDSVSL